MMKISILNCIKIQFFLSFEGDLSDPDVIWGNMNIYKLAFQRMKGHLKFENNLLAWGFKSATDLKISQNIYDYVISVWIYANEQLKSGNYILELNETNFTIKSKKIAITPRGAERLMEGNHIRNMNLCCRLVRDQVGGFLGQYILLDRKGTGMRPDGWGGYSCKG